ncbi:sensor histidine kinase [Qipengyuania nanhaisediminis]|uniref:histidine kinase n=1 Tax=Qipengyuania nanhaisediminis TaxID=604088 RepID=A0A1I5L5Z1_9SPHN|nr:CHASE3 domain-containing protein [Qipengyuania nanhaisediminis]SFO92675.1 Two-component sensor histidine kinase, contains HisKA and HATPase domains [Qipengyuania nanhaisediminis]
MKDFAALVRRGQRWPNAVLSLIIFGAMFALIFLVYQTLEGERREREQSRLTASVLAELQEVEYAALNAETGQRGYLITLDRRYLSSYQQGSEQIEPSLRRLRDLLGDETTVRQAELLDQIDSLARAKFSEMEESVMLIEDGRLLDARRSILSDEGQEAMERLRRAVDEMRVIERQILARQAADTARLEARILPLLGGLIILILVAILLGARLVSRAARAEAEAAQAAAVGEARDRADLLARELNHRVKNLFAVVLAIVQMSARDKPEAKPVTDSIAERIRALLTAHEVSQGALDTQLASLEALIDTSLAPYRSSTQTANIDGPEVLLPAKRITPLGLVFHELTTNAVKYGAWAHGGTIDVSWTRKDDRIKLVWRETGVPLDGEPDRKGFGSLLMNSAARQFGGTVERDFTKDGLIVTIDLPVEQGATSLASDPEAP